MMRTAVNSLPGFSAVRRQPVAHKSAQVRRRHIRHGVMLLATVMMLALLFVWTRIEVIQLGYEVSRLRRETSDLKEQRNLIQAEVASLKRPERLEPIARERFGMRPPQAGEIVTVPMAGE